jgi:hypothetical protein
MNNRRELEVLEVDLDQARLAQKCRAGQAHMREAKLEHHQNLVKEMLLGDIPEVMDEATLQEIVSNIRKKLDNLNI